MELDGPFAGWSIDYERGDLIDQCGNRYTPGLISAGRYLLGCMDLRDRLIFADDLVPRKLLVTADIGRSPQSVPRKSRKIL